MDASDSEEGTNKLQPYITYCNIRELLRLADPRNLYIPGRHCITWENHEKYQNIATLPTICCISECYIFWETLETATNKFTKNGKRYVIYNIITYFYTYLLYVFLLFLNIIFMKDYNFYQN